MVNLTFLKHRLVAKAFLFFTPTYPTSEQTLGLCGALASCTADVSSFIIHGVPLIFAAARALKRLAPLSALVAMQSQAPCCVPTTLSPPWLLTPRNAPSCNVRASRRLCLAAGEGT